MSDQRGIPRATPISWVKIANGSMPLDPRPWRRLLGGTGSAVIVVGLAALTQTDTASAQTEHAHSRSEEGYFRTVSEFFGIPLAEVNILHDWGLAADEVPLILFVAKRAGVSPEALIAKWRSGGSLATIMTHYRVGLVALHVPLPEGAPTGVLQRIYDELDSTPVGDWDGIELTGSEAVALVNLRLLARISRAGVAEILQMTNRHDNFVDLYAELLVRDATR